MPGANKAKVRKSSGSNALMRSLGGSGSNPTATSDSSDMPNSN